MGAPLNRARTMAPNLARIRGPLGPSGVKPMQLPFFKIRSIDRMAAFPLFLDAASTVLKPSR